MTDYLDLALRTGAVGLATYAVVGQLIKPAIRLIAKRFAGSGARSAIRWMVRSAAVAVGLVFGLLPLWPETFDGTAWGPMLGLVGGSFAIPLHSAVVKVLPEGVARILTGKSLDK